MRVEGTGFRVQGSGFRVQGSGFRVHVRTVAEMSPDQRRMIMPSMSTETITGAATSSVAPTIERVRSVMLFSNVTAMSHGRDTPESDAIGAAVSRRARDQHSVS